MSLPCRWRWVVWTSETKGHNPPDAIGHSYFIMEGMPVSMDESEHGFKVKAVWAGIRPLVVNEEARASTNVSAVLQEMVQAKPGLFSIAGGEWTTFRQMAGDTADKVIKPAWPRTFPKSSHQTAHLPLHGPLFRQENEPHHHRRTRLHSKCCTGVFVARPVFMNRIFKMI